VSGARRLASALIYALSAAVGVLAFVYPFFPVAAGPTRGQDAALVAAGLVGLALIGLLVELQGRTLSAKTVALLGVLVAISSVLRFIETAIPMPGGFSPVFAPVILAGFVFGSRFGFLMGAFTLLVSALITGAVGPWLPYQMFAAGWAGMTAGWLGRVRGLQQAQSRGSLRWQGLLALAVFGFAWGLLYGVVINLYFWPFASGATDQTWAPGLSLWETLRRYAAFYAVTSLAWDLARAVGNSALILLLGPATIGALTRFRRRFYFEVLPVDA
jgi:energy-coupling factor transport system substrate-specific component